MIRKITLLFIVLLLSFITQLSSQTNESVLFQHLDIAVIGGTSGLGFDVGATVNEHVKVRAGFSYMPHIKFPLGLQVTLEDGFEGIDYADDDMKGQYSKMKQLLSMMNDLTGIEADNEVYINIVPTFYNGKLLVDWYPFRDKSWHFTTGIYFGPSRVGIATNYDDETAFLLALNGYNHIYENVKNENDIINVGGAGFEFTPEINEKILNYGRATFYIGPKKDGSYYHTVPTNEGFVSADCYTNAIKPYLGFGYGKSIGRSGRCTLSFEGGCLIWGGTPRIITHDGVDLAHDMEYIKKTTLRHLVDWISAMKVYPMLEARVAWQIF